MRKSLTPSKIPRAVKQEASQTYHTIKNLSNLEIENEQLSYQLQNVTQQLLDLEKSFCDVISLTNFLQIEVFIFNNCNCIHSSFIIYIS